MNIAVRYYSRSGNTKALADAIAAAAGVKALSVDAPGAEITEPVDVLFIGGAVYAYGIDKKLTQYLKNLPQGIAGKAAVFSTSWISRHAIELIRKGLEEKGILVEEEAFHVKSKPGEEQLKEAAAFAGRYI